jgi:surface polysaccharide O-acyltransferase-like enzyme
VSENRFIYAVKFLACFAVITIHVRFPGEFGNYCFALARFAVPFFFVVSGRYLLVGDRSTADNETGFIRQRTQRALKKLCKNTLIVYLVYLIYSFIYHILNGFSFIEWFSSKFNRGEAFNFILFNSGRFIYDPSYTFDHLWFLFALIYVYVLIWLFAGGLRKMCKGLIVLLIFLLFFGEALQTFYPIRPFGININTWFVLRNWLLVGMPFVLIGIAFSEHVKNVKDSLTVGQIVSQMKKWRIVAFFALIVGIICTVLEYRLLGNKEVYIGSLIITVALLYLSESGISGGSFLWRLGKNYSDRIYYYHVLILTLSDLVVGRFFVTEWLLWFKPFYIMLICIVFFTITGKFRAGEH